MGAAVLMVNSFADNTTDTSLLTLRDAINVVNAQSTSGLSSTQLAQVIDGTFGSGDTIEFDPGLDNQTILLNGTQLPTIIDPQSLAITGLGSSLLSISGNYESRVFEIDAGPVTISGLTITDGKSTTNGGGILVDPSGSPSPNFLTIKSSIISGNTAANGGGIVNHGNLTLENSTISGNKSSDAGGGIANYLYLTVQSSTISGNSAGTHGGGVANPFETPTPTVAINSSTLAYNYAGAYGGAIASASTVSVNDGTITGNTTGPMGTGGGIGIGEGSLGLRSTILAGNGVGSGGHGPDLDGSAAAITSNGNNLIGITTLSGTTSPWQSTDQLGTSTPLLGPLQNNGGQTQTMALLPGSPAIGTGKASATGTDQRGYLFGTSPDIGDFQSEFVDNFTTNSGLDSTNSFSYNSNSVANTSNSKWKTPDGFHYFNFYNRQAKPASFFYSAGYFDGGYQYQNQYTIPLNMAVIGASPDASNVSVGATVALPDFAHSGSLGIDYAGVVARETPASVNGGISASFYFGLLYEDLNTDTYLAQLGVFQNGYPTVFGTCDLSANASVFNFSDSTPPNGNLQPGRSRVELEALLEWRC